MSSPCSCPHPASSWRMPNPPFGCYVCWCEAEIIRLSLSGEGVASEPRASKGSRVRADAPSPDKKARQLRTEIRRVPRFLFGADSAASREGDR